jgi:hypothetical protein
MEEKILVTIYCKKLHTIRENNERKSTEHWKDNTMAYIAAGCLTGDKTNHVTRNELGARK